MPPLLEVPVHSTETHPSDAADIAATWLCTLDCFILRLEGFMYWSKTMICKSAILTVTVSMITSAGLVSAAPAPQAARTTETTTVNATITAIDKANRAVTLTGPQGNSITVHAGEGVKRFNDLKVGDQVSATYSESVAWSVRPSGQPAPPRETQSTTRRAEGPGGTVTSQQTVSVTVEAIDPAAPSVTVRGPQGGTQTFKVENPKNLENLKVGDKVDISYTQALLLRVDPPTK